MKSNTKMLLIVGITSFLLGIGLNECFETCQNKNNETTHEITPDIQFRYEWGLKVISAYPQGLEWSDINITVSNGSYRYIGLHIGEMTSCIHPYRNGSSCPTGWGHILIGEEIAIPDHGILYQNNTMTVTLRWIPTNEIIGEWILPPMISFSEDTNARRLTVGSISSSDLSWSNINITISTGNYSNIYFYPNVSSSIIYFYGNHSFCPFYWGDIKSGNIISFPKCTVSIKWIPTDTILGEWDFT